MAINTTLEQALKYARELQNGDRPGVEKMAGIADEMTKPANGRFVMPKEYKLNEEITFAKFPNMDALFGAPPTPIDLGEDPPLRLLFSDEHRPAKAFGNHGPKSIAYLRQIASISGIEITEWPVSVFLNEDGQLHKTKGDLNRALFAYAKTKEVATPPDNFQDILKEAANDLAAISLKYVARRKEDLKEKLVEYHDNWTRQCEELNHYNDAFQEAAAELRAMGEEPAKVVPQKTIDGIADELKNGFWAEQIRDESIWPGDRKLVYRTPPITLYENVGGQTKTFNFGVYRVAIHLTKGSIVMRSDVRYPDGEPGWRARHPYQPGDVSEWRTLCYGEEKERYNAAMAKGDIARQMRLTREVMTYFNPRSQGYYCPSAAIEEIKTNKKMVASTWRITEFDTPVANVANGEPAFEEEIGF